MRKLAFFLALLMLVGTAACACASSDAEPQTADTTASPDTTGTDSQTEPVETSVLDTLPTGTYDGYEFNFLTVDISWCDYEGLNVEEITGESVNDAMFKRNQIVAEKLGVVFGETICSESEAQNAVKKQVLTNEKTYDVWQTTSSAANSLALSGNLMNLSDSVNFDFSKPWWDQAYNEDSNVRDDNGVYVAFGDLCLTFVGGTFVLGFNTQMIEDYGLESPYTHWNNGTWTWDVMHQMCTQVNTDKNGDGNKTSLDSDIFGMIGHVNQIKHFIMSSGASLLTTGADGTLCMNSDNEKYYDAFTRVMELFVNDTSCVFTTAYSGYSTYNSSVNSGIEGYIQIFNEGRALFHLNLTAAFKSCREAEIGYGIVGLPKYDGAQDDYYNIAYANVRGMAMPASFTDDEFERNAVILENLAAYSHEYVVPAFVEITLYYKYAKDSTSVQILSDIMSSEKYCDQAFAYNWAGCISLIEQLAISHRTSITSALKGIESKFNKAILQTIGD